MANSARKTILIVEDEAIVALCETRTMRELGYDVVAVRTGEDAVDLARGGGKIDLVLMDIDLGRGMDGIEAARSMLAFRNLPIVFLTGHSDMSFVEKAREIAPYGYVTKSSGDFVLRVSIEAAFELFDAFERLREERKGLEQRASALEASEALVLPLLEEKDILLKELRHRVKDGLSNLISLHSLQAESTGDAGISDALMRARSRIQCLEVLCGKLDIRERNPFIPAREYFDEVLPEILQASEPPCSISLLSEIDDVLLPADCIFPLGIMASELIAHAVKHAFPDRGGGTIGVGLHVGQGSECVLSIRDDGTGMRMPLPRSGPAGFGALLVEAMSRQLRAEVEMRSDSGTAYLISFPAESRARGPGGLTSA